LLRTHLVLAALLLAGATAHAKEATPSGDAPKPGGDKEMAGMSIVGNDDAPKALVIVPWKSSGLGDVLDVSRALDDGRNPVDRDVFMRELEYYEIRAASGAQSSGTQSLGQ
jgi:hypothetical protein